MIDFQGLSGPQGRGDKSVGGLITLHRLKYARLLPYTNKGDEHEDGREHDQQMMDGIQPVDQQILSPFWGLEIFDPRSLGKPAFVRHAWAIRTFH